MVCCLRVERLIPVSPVAIMVAQFRFVGEPPRHRSRRDRWRSWVAHCALVALVWPSLGTLPWLAMDFGASVHASAHAATGVAAEAGAAHHDHADASEVPGSPTHPPDHDCFQCQVLAHLARCVLLAASPSALPAAPVCPVAPAPVVLPHYARLIVVLPPARAPPRATA
jgi:hypothetical protein